LKLMEFYRQLFLQAIHVYEPVWEEEPSVQFGYRWHKRNYPLLEQFEIKDTYPSNPILMYSLVLPEAYLETSIYEEIKYYPSRFDLSLFLLDRKLWLNAALPAGNLQDSIMGYINQARSDLMNILDNIIQIPDKPMLVSTLTDS